MSQSYSLREFRGYVLIIQSLRKLTTGSFHPELKINTILSIINSSLHQN